MTNHQSIEGQRADTLMGYAFPYESGLHTHSATRLLVAAYLNASWGVADAFTTAGTWP